MSCLTLLETADLLAELLELPEVTAGATDTSLTETVGVYQRGDFVLRECIGTESSYQVLRLRLLVRWTASPAAAEAKAYELAELLAALRDMETAAHVIKFARIKGVRSIGKDEKGICEYIVDADIIYNS